MEGSAPPTRQEPGSALPPGHPEVEADQALKSGARRIGLRQRGSGCERDGRAGAPRRADLSLSCLYLDHRDARAASAGLGRVKARYQRVAPQQVAHGIAKGACAIAVDDPHRVKAGEKGIVQESVEHGLSFIGPSPTQV